MVDMSRYRVTVQRSEVERRALAPESYACSHPASPPGEVGNVKVRTMADSAAGSTGRIFISYRREDTAYPAGWLYDRLADRYGEGQVFKDVDSIELGDDFVQVISRAVGSCDVLLALIGGQWLTITDAQGRRRLDHPDDFVRLEIEAALTRNVRVIPILVGGATMPDADELPDSLAGLVRRQALELSPARFDFDTGRLLKVLDRTLAEVRVTQQDAAAIGLPQAPPQPKPAAPPGTPLATTAGPATPRPPRTWILAGAAVGVVLLLLIVLIVANSGAEPQTQSGTTASPTTGAVTTTTVPPTTKPIFQDNFSSRKSGWEGDGSQASGAGYANDAYRVSAPPSAEGSGAGSVPRKASRVFPSAPANLRIEVEGRRLPASDRSMEYGILCRINSDENDAYAFTVSDNYADIARLGNYRKLMDAEIEVDPDLPTRLRAVCVSVKGQNAVHLELWVNDKKAIQTTDEDSPLQAGGVGLFVGTSQTTRASVAEFDDFVVGLAPEQG
jgi:hypothetical protein